ncbi:hypothetical protein ACFWR9_40825 [Streptomyces sp. NPDC058534]|uniref:hypothetical protein n=1 Tax=Streptomyces sp. NPDC058534 TaxID=3346541 RepID=UPI0036615AF4
MRGLRAAEAKGSTGGRRPAFPPDKTDAVRAGYLEIRSIAGIARCTASAAARSARLPPTSCAARAVLDQGVTYGKGRGTPCASPPYKAGREYANQVNAVEQ